MNAYEKNGFVEPRGPYGLRRVLKGWVFQQRKYSEAMKKYKDHACGYRERSCIGFLLAGAWRNGGAALQEWPVTKRSKKRTWHGHSDLYIWHRGKEFFIEAKHCYVGADSPSLLKKIEFKLAEATRDASHVRAGTGRRVGLVFIVPTFRKSEYASVSLQLPKFLQQVRKIRHSAMAWLRLSTAQLKISPEWCSTPGVVLLARFTRS